ncbi:MAG: preprotein translocase subunit SecE [Bacilli bacterium]|nr:preprotein translocase subunit SecE [Bacilli bacterium]MDD3304674.1 preprotein translocase subunit SecE [Bacilli bacterium]MDD4053274.1 preprotein translocase subunit SecE [Bacilli bacterium]MDD4411386.1 preprotein translocase subunit SecE [Bacilli bacterium]
MEKLKFFLYGVKKEVGRVRWPNKKDMVKYTIAVLTSGFFFGIFFFVINFIVVVIKDVFR